ncbi:IS66-like element accessory protein TnpA [Prosthecomicrobium sp. N25]|uniref:IS66-like element accessory protein TnpA n=1 Tax=Prosthecomicrobium sp. N25 TaxID=3129254 RepID=UPI003076D6B0
MKVEVLGAERRRRWRDEEKARIVAETLGGAETVSEVARRHDICPSLVFTWRRQAREGRLGSVRDAPPLLPVTIEGDGAATACGSDRSRRDCRDFRVWPERLNGIRRGPS